MAKWKNKKEENHTRVAVYEYYHLLLGIATELALNRFKWHGISNEAAILIEHNLQFLGYCSISKVGSEIVPMQVSGISEFNYLGFPAKWQARNIYGNLELDCTADNDIFGYNSNTCLPIYAGAASAGIAPVKNYFTDIITCVKRMVQVMHTQDVNLLFQETPRIFKGGQGDMKDLNNLIHSIGVGKSFIPWLVSASDAIIGDSIEVLDIAKEYQPELYNVDFANRWRILLRLLGINHLQFEKKSEIKETEVAANNQELNIIIRDKMLPRIAIAEQMKEKFGVGCEVEFDQMAIMQMISENEAALGIDHVSDEVRSGIR